MTIGKRGGARLLLLPLIAAGIAAVWYGRAWFDPVALAGSLAGNRAAPLVFLAVHIVASLFFVPRTLLALSAGMLFGMWWGILWAAVGSVAGAVAGFLIARYINTGFLDRADAGRLALLLRRAEAGGWRIVALVRLVPLLPHSLTNYALGLTRVGLVAYAVGSLLGQLPMTVAYANFGAGGRALLGGGDWRHELLWPSLIGATALALSLLIPMLLRRRLKPTEPAPPIPAA